MDGEIDGRMDGERGKREEEVQGGDTEGEINKTQGWPPIRKRAERMKWERERGRDRDGDRNSDRETERQRERETERERARERAREGEVCRL
jgi:hypothetical protein